MSSGQPATGAAPAAPVVLLVEDNADAREALRALLELDGYGVEAAADGARALEIVQARPPDIAVIDVRGPESPDSLFARALGGEFDWVLALYHDQGLIAVKTAAFGVATNWTIGLPFLRTSVDHGTAFAIAGTGSADAAPLAAVVRTTLELLAGRAAAPR